MYHLKSLPGLTHPNVSITIVFLLYKALKLAVLFMPKHLAHLAF